ncbi:MAG: FAD-dependent oxidoreductase [Acidimicrobiales bacterium]|nr:MAG: FAD-dependent oxidoreductase [Acidimicrobiales bacterium]
MTWTARHPRIVIVGAGLAGLRAAERLSELNFDGEVLIIGEEQHRPYHRPGLIDQLLTGKLDSHDMALRTYVELGDCWRIGTRVYRLDPAQHLLYLPGAEKLRYDGLIIATGLRPRLLPGAPLRDPRVHLLRTLDEAAAIRSTLAASKGRVVVIGTGFTGCEVAASMRSLHRKVTIVGRSRTLLGNALGAEFGAQINGLHQRNGTDLALGTKPRDWHCTPDYVEIRLSDERTLQASCVILAVGSVPGTQWLRGSGIDITDGVLCEPTCFVVGVEDVVAAGDVACWPNPRFDVGPNRYEHWLNAAEMGQAAAENLLTGRSQAHPYSPLPRFWSEQYGMRIQVAGMPALATKTLSLTKPSSASWKPIVDYFKDGQQIGVVGVDQPRKMLRLIRNLSTESALLMP